jgi:hydroxymethylpyrimidine pyrophosphatase-like HAD family hydrolase
MLGWAGIGWAVASGHEQVRRAADRECPGNDDDGVAHVLEALLRQKV